MTERERLLADLANSYTDPAPVDRDECSVSVDGMHHFGKGEEVCRFCLRPDEGQRLLFLRETARLAMDAETLHRVPPAAWVDIDFVLQLLDKALRALRSAEREEKTND